MACLTAMVERLDTGNCTYHIVGDNGVNCECSSNMWGPFLTDDLEDHQANIAPSPVEIDSDREAEYVFATLKERLLLAEQDVLKFMGQASRGTQSHLPRRADTEESSTISCVHVESNSKDRMDGEEEEKATKSCLRLFPRRKSLRRRMRLVGREEQ